MNIDKNDEYDHDAECEQALHDENKRLGKLAADGIKLKALVRSLIGDVEAMECQMPEGYEANHPDEEGHWYGSFGVGHMDMNDYNVSIQWPCLGILMEQLKEAVK